MELHPTTIGLLIEVTVFVQRREWRRIRQALVEILDRIKRCVWRLSLLGGLPLFQSDFLVLAQMLDCLPHRSRVDSNPTSERVVDLKDQYRCPRNCQG